MQLRAMSRQLLLATLMVLASQMGGLQTSWAKPRTRFKSSKSSVPVVSFSKIYEELKSEQIYFEGAYSQMDSSQPRPGCLSRWPAYQQAESMQEPVEILEVKAGFLLDVPIEDLNADEILSAENLKLILGATELRPLSTRPEEWLVYTRQDLILFSVAFQYKMQHRLYKYDNFDQFVDADSKSAPPFLRCHLVNDFRLGTPQKVLFSKQYEYDKVLHASDFVLRLIPTAKGSLVLIDYNAFIKESAYSYAGFNALFERLVQNTVVRNFHLFSQEETLGRR